MNRIATASYLCLALMGCSGSFAAPNDDPTEPAEISWRRVHFGDLDLTHDSGVATLYSRIHAAANAVCPADRDWADKWVEHAASCRFQAMARAVAQVNAPLLTSYYEAKSRKR